MSRGDAGGLGVPGAHGEHLTPTGCSAARGHAGEGERLAQTHWAPSTATVWRLAWFPLSPAAFMSPFQRAKRQREEVSFFLALHSPKGVSFALMLREDSGPLAV